MSLFGSNDDSNSENSNCPHGNDPMSCDTCRQDQLATLREILEPK